MIRHFVDFVLSIKAPRPCPGPHKLRECLPMAVFLRNRLHYALNYSEVKKIVKQRLIKVDGRVRTHHCFPTGFMGTNYFLNQRSFTQYFISHFYSYLQTWFQSKRRVSTSGFCTTWKAASWCMRLQARRPSTNSVRFDECTLGRAVYRSSPLTTVARFAIPTRSSRRTILFSSTLHLAKSVSSSSLSPVRFYLYLSCTLLRKAALSCSLLEYARR